MHSKEEMDRLLAKELELIENEELKETELKSRTNTLQAKADSKGSYQTAKF